MAQSTLKIPGTGAVFQGSGAGSLADPFLPTISQSVPTGAVPVFGTGANFGVTGSGTPESPYVLCVGTNESVFQAGGTVVNYQITARSSGLLVLMFGSVSNTVTIPSSANLAAPLPLGFTLDFFQNSAQQTAFVTDGGGAIIDSYNSLTHLAGQFAAASLVQTHVDEWALIGNLA